MSTAASGMFSVNLRAFVDEARRVAEQGCVVKPVRAALERIKQPRCREQRVLYALVREIIEGNESRLSDAERQLIERELRGFKDRQFDAERQRLIEYVGSLTSRSLWSPGRALILASGPSPFLGQPWGVVAEVVVTATLWTGELAVHTVEKETFSAVRTACEAARYYLQKQPAFRPISQAALLRDYGLVVELSSPGLPVEGGSVGLGVALAALSAMTGIELPRDTAFTGVIRNQAGDVDRVGGLLEKLGAAVEKGLEHVILPAANGSEVGNLSVPVTVKTVASLDEAVAMVFELSALENAFDGLTKIVVPEAVSRRVWLEPSVQSVGPRVLLSMVGKSDPIGTIKDQHGQPLSREEGPILGAVRELSPQHLYLFYTTQKPDNDLTNNAKETERFLKESGVNRQVNPVALDHLDDPSDLSLVLGVVRPQVESLVNLQRFRDAAFFVNVTSGTPATFAAWMWLVEHGVLPRTTKLVQVLERRFAERRPGERVRPVEWPAA